MEPDLVAGTIVLVLLFVSIAFWWRASRGRAAAAAKAAALGRQLEATRALEQRRATGEREGAWATRATAARLDEALQAATTAFEQIGGLTDEIDDLRTRLVTADQDLTAARRDADEGATRLAELEGELEAARRGAVAADDLQARYSAVVRERDRLSATAQRVEHLEAELSALGKVHQDLAAARAEAAELKAQAAAAAESAEAGRAAVARLEKDTARLRQELADGRSNADRKVAAAAADLQSAQERLVVVEAELADLQSVEGRLVASEARRNELEDRLTAVTAARNAERRRTADRIAGLERLHVDVGERDDRIGELEAEVKDLAESRDDAIAAAGRLEVQITKLRATLADAEEKRASLSATREEFQKAEEKIESLQQELSRRRPDDAELERLRRSLEAEKARSQRMAERAVAEKVPTVYADWDRTLRERVARAVDEATARRTAEVEHLRAVVAEKERALARLSATGPTASSLTSIKGIGPVIAGILEEQGITTVADVAALDDADIDRLGELMPVYPGRIRRDDWVGQAAALLT